MHTCKISFYHSTFASLEEGFHSVLTYSDMISRWWEPFHVLWKATTGHFLHCANPIAIPGKLMINGVEKIVNDENDISVGVTMTR